MVVTLEGGIKLNRTRRAPTLYARSCDVSRITLTFGQCEQVEITPHVDDIRYYGGGITNTNPLVAALQDKGYCVASDINFEDPGITLVFDTKVFHETSDQPIPIRFEIRQSDEFERSYRVLRAAGDHIEYCFKSGDPDDAPTDEELLKLCIPVVAWVPKPMGMELH